MTGTGSGKTESFLLPILAKLAQKASHKPLDLRTSRACELSFSIR